MLITTVRICGHVYCWVSAKPVSANREDTVAVATDCLSAGAAWTHNPAPGPGGDDCGTAIRPRVPLQSGKILKCWT